MLNISVASAICAALIALITIDPVDRTVCEEKVAISMRMDGKPHGIATKSGLKIETFSSWLADHIRCFA
ncbi:unnamed protein product [Protopolystoma xenopodis]|uniref:Uncharacterized protein n=1 Tax=Protopolystoma xenopodis TaxID=117903 RepID=A0A448WZG8_9PLAT|nr:unnamed protein product [Protopolystoma xenopodis]